MSIFTKANVRLDCSSANAGIIIIERKNITGIFNVGTGKPNSFNTLAQHIIKWHMKGNIEYINFPKKLENTYQHFTKANLNNLRKAGYKNKFININKGIDLYLNNLNNLD